MDAYRNQNKIVLWIKTRDEDIRLERDFEHIIYLDPKARPALIRKRIAFESVKRKTYQGNYAQVLAVKIPYLSFFEKFISSLEKQTRYRVPFFDADIAPEQMFLYKNDLIPCYPIQIHKETIMKIDNGYDIPLREIDIRIEGNPLHTIEAAGKTLKGEEKEILSQFIGIFNSIDPDVIRMDRGYSMLPFLEGRLFYHNIPSPFHRWDSYPLKARGGRSYWSYGTVRYQDYSVRLRGRFLVDTSTSVGSECESDAIMELCHLSGTLFQQTASRSFGAAFQTALMRTMVQRGILVPFKEKPIEPPISMRDMLKCDRGGHYYDLKIGFHQNVAEIDFTSMFPWLIYNHNISAECILSKKGPLENIPNTPFTTSLRYKGLIPLALKPFIDRRMYYKKNPSLVNKKKARGLKWVLVSCYGYLRFREFKLGIPSSHMAICSYARETLLEVVRLAEERGFEVIHAIVDSMYLTKKDMSVDEVKDFCSEVEQLSGIPVWFEGMFKWIVFLPSVVDPNRALPATYYGIFSSGDIKVRGIELRQNSAPRIVKYFQTECIMELRECATYEEVREKIPFLLSHLRFTIQKIERIDPKYLIASVKIGKTEYQHNIPQKVIVRRLRQQGVALNPGNYIQFIYGRNGPVLPQEYDGKADVLQYRKLLVRSLFVILQPFGVTKEMIEQRAHAEFQALITDYIGKRVIGSRSFPSEEMVSA